jgi:hypothetical protein
VIATTRSSTFTDRSVRGRMIYYYRVGANDTSGNKSPTSDYVTGHPTVPYVQTLDNRDTGFSASSAWSTSSAVPTRYGADYRYAAPKPVSDPASFKLRAVPRAGRYQLYFRHPAHSRYSQSAPVLIRAPAGNARKLFDLRSDGGRWLDLGTYSRGAGDAPSVLMSRWTGAPGWLIADAVRIVAR